MSDDISKKAVLDFIKEVCFSKEQKWVDFRASQGSNGQRDLIINFIEQLPPVIPMQTRWIPVSERLPKKGEIVLWCNKEGRVFSSAITYITKTSFSVGKHYDVIAWMPLPQPYKAESEDRYEV